MFNHYLQVTITLQDPQANDEQLQEAVGNLRQEIEEVNGVKEANFVPVKQAPPNSKSSGGFLLGVLKAVIKVEDFRNLVSFLGGRLFGRTIEIKAEGNGKKLEVKVSSQEDLELALKQVKEFFN